MSPTREALEQSAPLPARWDLDYLELLLAGACDFLTRLDREWPRSHKVFEVRLETQLQLDVRSPMIRFRPCSRPWATP